MTVEDRRIAALSGAVGALLCLIALAMASMDAHAALTGWLAAFAFVSALPLGSLCLALTLRIIPGQWREMLQPQTDLVALGFPLLIVLVLPVLFGLPDIYPWAGGAELSGFKAAYLAPAFFAVRILVILCGASLLVIALRRQPPGRAALSVFGLVAFMPLHGVLSVDWLMSLDPKFHSSGFGLYILAGQVLTAFAALIVFRSPGRGEKQIAVLGPLLLTLLLLWAYVAFMQYFILWSGNLPPGVAWYRQRGEGGWAIVEYLIAASRLLPAFLLFFPPIRGHRRFLIALSVIVLFGSLLECAWLVLPSAGAGMGLATASFGLALIGMLLLYPSAIFLGAAAVAAKARRRRSA
ncbi:hypothetical protein [Neorhizobium petrolearium]|uniref:hypothetical protein n=1 Tax=Neorhizobium petrolearium TaxID=515361 RepID=UPI003F188DC0